MGHRSGWTVSGAPCFVALSNTVKVAIALGVAGGALYAVRSAGQLQAVGDNLSPEVKVKVHKFGWSGINLRVFLRLKNPTGGTMRMVRPFLTVFANAAEIGSSDISSREITIPPFGFVDVDPITVNIGLLALLGPLKQVFEDLIDGWSARRPMILTVRPQTRINGLIPFTRDITVSVIPE